MGKKLPKRKIHYIPLAFYNSEAEAEREYDTYTKCPFCGVYYEGALRDRCPHAKCKN